MLPSRSDRVTTRRDSRPVQREADPSDPHRGDESTDRDAADETPGSSTEPSVPPRSRSVCVGLGLTCFLLTPWIYFAWLLGCLLAGFLRRAGVRDGAVTGALTAFGPSALFFGAVGIAMVLDGESVSSSSSGVGGSWLGVAATAGFEGAVSVVFHALLVGSFVAVLTILGALAGGVGGAIDRVLRARRIGVLTIGG